MVRASSIFILVQLLLGSCTRPGSDKAQVLTIPTSITDTCNDPDANIECCFIEIPKKLTHVMHIGETGIPGERMVISGRVIRQDGAPISGALLYAYHTDHTGHYSKNGKEKGFQKWHGHLHGWCITNGLGRYELRSIRPAPYPSNTMPAHIHCAIKEPIGRTYYINDFVFHDGTLVNEHYLNSLRLTGGQGIVKLQKNTAGTWVGERDILID